MKYVILLPMLCMISVSFSSCDKDFTCRCESGGWGTGPIDVQIKAHDKNAAKVKCRTMYDGWDDAPEDCRLK